MQSISNKMTYTVLLTMLVCCLLPSSPLFVSQEHQQLGLHRGAEAGISDAFKSFFTVSEKQATKRVSSMHSLSDAEKQMKIASLTGSKRKGRIAVAAAAVGGGGYYAYKKTHSSDDTAAATASPAADTATQASTSSATGAGYQQQYDTNGMPLTSDASTAGTTTGYTSGSTAGSTSGYTSDSTAAYAPGYTTSDATTGSTSGTTVY
jgi:hypothetical protein